jgi:hypothetical protein
VGPLDVAILVWGGRFTTVAFFVCGGSQLVLPSFPPGSIQGLRACFFFMVAMLFLVMAEAIAVQLVWVNLLRERKDKHAQVELRNILRSIFGVFGMAAATIKRIRQATVEPTRGRKKS